RNASCATSSALFPSIRARKARSGRSYFSTSMAKAAPSPREARLESARSSSFSGVTRAFPPLHEKAQPQGGSNDQREERGRDSFMDPSRIADDDAGRDHRDADGD